MSEIYKGGAITDLNIIEQISSLPNTSFFDIVYKAEKIKDFANDQFFKGHLAPILIKICVLAGIKNEIDQFTKRDIMNMLFTRFKNLSTADIWKAFELERYGVYDEKTEHFQLFDSNYVATVLKKYQEWKQREKTMINYKPPTLEENLLPEISDSQKKQIITDAIIKSFTYFKENGKLSDDIQTHIFDELYSRGFIVDKTKPDYNENTTTNYFIKQQQKAYQELEAEYKEGAKTKNRDYYKSALKELENNTSGAVIARMKRNVLSAFFERYKDDNAMFEKIKNS